MIRQTISILFIFLCIASCKINHSMPATHAFRLKPGQDLKQFCKRKKYTGRMDRYLRGKPYRL
jgi:hypothetical protein